MKKLTYLLLLVLLVSACKDPSDKFIGEWKNPKFKGEDINKILITKMGKNQVLVDYIIQRNVGMFGHKLLDKNGSFKEVGTIDGNIIQINQSTKLSLIENDTKILLNNTEFIKDETLITINGQEIEHNSSPSNAEKEKMEAKRKQDSLAFAIKASDSLAALEASMNGDDEETQRTLARLARDEAYQKSMDYEYSFFITSIPSGYLVFKVNNKEFKIKNVLDYDYYKTLSPKDGELAEFSYGKSNDLWQKIVYAINNEKGDIEIKSYDYREDKAIYGGETILLKTIKKSMYE